MKNEVLLCLNLSKMAHLVDHVKLINLVIHLHPMSMLSRQIQRFSSIKFEFRRISRHADFNREVRQGNSNGKLQNAGNPALSPSTAILGRRLYSTSFPNHLSLLAARNHLSLLAITCHCSHCPNSNSGFAYSRLRVT